MNKNLSIITNFGCSTNCEYCIWKNHKEASIIGANLSKLPQLLETDFYGIEKFSISGGGDPLFNIDKNLDFWLEINHIAKFYNKKIDIHTSMPEVIMKSDQFSGIDKLFSSILNRLVIHIPTTGPNAITSFYEYFQTKASLYSNYKLRFNIVVTDKILINQLKFFENKIKETERAIQIGYRELVGNEELKPTLAVVEYAKGIEGRYNNGKYIKQNDYNTYLWASGEITDTFL